MTQLNGRHEELEHRLEDIEHRVERLKSLYEQYFQGIERLEPRLERTRLHNLVQELRKSQVRNTALRFRINQLVARMNTYENYWNRTVRQIEEGTYRRDLFRARYRAGLVKPGEQLAAEKQPASETGTAAANTSASAAPARATADPLNETNVRSLFNAYVTAKRRCREPVKGLTEQALANTLRKQVPSIMKQYKCKGVEFKVVIKQGKAILKAVPKF